MAKGGQKKQSIRQRWRREKKGVGGAETGAGESNIPASQIAHKKAAISRADWLKDECDFRGIDSSEVEACCYYEYLRESVAMRHSFGQQVNQRLIIRYIKPDGKGMVLVSPEREGSQTVIHADSGLALPHGVNQTARSALAFVLIKAGWHKAANKNEAPPPWQTLDAQIKEEVARCAKRCLERRTKDLKWHPPLLVQEFLPGHDPVELESQVEKWKEEAYYAASGERSYFFGLFRLDQTYNETEAVKAFRGLLRKRYGKTKGGNRERSRAKLNDLVVMRLWKRFPDDPFKRVEHVAKFTTAGFKGCKDYWNERCKAKKAKLGLVEERMSKAANEEMSRARADALKFFQYLFPGERPLSY
jgi:hypothetical protein